jgi:hypothetical protein
MTNEDWKLKEKDIMMLILPTTDGKDIVAKMVIKDEPVETLKDAIIELPEQDGKKPNLKWPIVLVRDLDQLRDKLIEDIKSNEDNWLGKGSVDLDEECQEAIIKIINKRFGYE